MIIDPPSVFAAVEEWQAFLEDLERLRRDGERDTAIAEHIAWAERMIAEKSSNTP